MLAELYVVYPLTREWVRAVYSGSAEHIQQLKQAINDAVEREHQLEGMRTDIYIDLQNTVIERRRLQRELWQAERLG